jgi:hypothetical protein
MPEMQRAVQGGFRVHSAFGEQVLWVGEDDADRGLFHGFDRTVFAFAENITYVYFRNDGIHSLHKTQYIIISAI